jgi:chemotaxis protein MotB
MRKIGVVAAALVATACVSSGKYDQKSLEADTFRKNLASELEKTSDLEKRVQVLEGQKTALEQRLEAAGVSLAEREAALKQAADKAAQLEAKNVELVKKSSEYEQLASTLKSEIDQGKIELTELKGKMTVKLKDKILFASGSAALGKEGKDALAKVAEAFRDLKGRIVRVEGHTDDRPIGSAAFPSNWELSGARALAVVRFLQAKGVDPAVLAGAAYAEYRPVAPNETPEGRSQNRRIEIVLAPAE